MSLLIALCLLLTSTWAYAQSSTDERSMDEFGMLIYDPSPDRDFPMVFQNRRAVQRNIESVVCYVLGGKVTILPVLTEKVPTSILRRHLTCEEGLWTAGQLSERPFLRSFARNGTACPNPPCTIDLNIESIEGRPHYLLITIPTRVPRGGEPATLPALRMKGR